MLLAASSFGTGWGAPDAKDHFSYLTAGQIFDLAGTVVSDSDFSPLRVKARG